MLLVTGMIGAGNAGLLITGMSAFSTLSTAFGFQILSLRREIMQTKGLDIDRRTLARRRLENSLRTLALRWILSFFFGVGGTIVGLILREMSRTQSATLIVLLGLALCSASIFFLGLMVLQYFALSRLATDLADRAEEFKTRREWRDKFRNARAGRVPIGIFLL